MSITSDLVALIEAQDTNKAALFERAGISKTTFYNWRNKTRYPTVFAIECVANALGYRIKLERIEP